LSGSPLEGGPGPAANRSGTRLFLLVTAVTITALAATSIALWRLGALEMTPGQVAGLFGFLAAATLAEAYPVPVPGVSADGVSLAAVVITGCAVLHGWERAAVIGLLAPALIDGLRRRPAVRLAYNASTYALAGAAAGVAGSYSRGDGALDLLFAVAVGAGVFYFVNVVLIAAAVASAEGVSFGLILHRSVAGTAATFGIMASVTLTLVVLWERSPFLVGALVGPLTAVVLYQRSIHRALEALRLARTDPLTGLGNHRHFHERLRAALEASRAHGAPLTVCLLDLDDLKGINDRYGHPIGDRVLASVAAYLRRDGEAFRLGGDEFALLLPGRDEEEGLAVARRVVERIAVPVFEHGAHVRISGGIASFPEHGVAAADLVEVADTALYWAKAAGKNRVCSYSRELVALAASSRPGDEIGWRARLRAASSLAQTVDEREAIESRHSEAVGDLAAKLALRMGMSDHEVELVRLAGRLHDIGKLAVPREVLRKASELTESERGIVERHPQIGYRMLESLGVHPMSTWVLHHHERWDGSGYPDRLAGENIPLAARVLSVADAFDAMTRARAFRGQPRSTVEAVAELRRCAGTQFDPEVVEALVAELSESRRDAAVTGPAGGRRGVRRASQPPRAVRSVV
jgi:diguanylate cyclase (GGDEF)-like protein